MGGGVAHFQDLVHDEHGCGGCELPVFGSPIPRRDVVFGAHVPLDPQRGLNWRARHVGAGFLAHDDLGVPPHGALDGHFGCAPDGVAYHGATVVTMLDVVDVERRHPHGCLEMVLEHDVLVKRRLHYGEERDHELGDVEVGRIPRGVGDDLDVVDGV